MWDCMWVRDRLRLWMRMRDSVRMWNTPSARIQVQARVVAAQLQLGLVVSAVSASPRNPYVPRTRDLKVQLPHPSAPGAPKKLDKVGGVVGIAMNSVLFVNEHPGDWGGVSVCVVWG